MNEVRFVELVAASIGNALNAVMQRGPDDSRDELFAASPRFHRLCRGAAWRLYADADGAMLLDLALRKLAAEQALGEPSP